MEDQYEEGDDGERGEADRRHLTRTRVPASRRASVIGADGRVISVGISAALFGLSGFWHLPRGTDLSLPGNQMTVTAQHPYRVATPRTVERLEQARGTPLRFVRCLGSPSTE